MTTAADYLWFGERFPDLAEAYCLTLVRGLAPDEVLVRFGAQPGEVRSFAGVRELIKPAYDAWDEHNGDALFMGVAGVGDWALAIEPNGYLGVTEPVAVTVSAGTRLVSHFRNVNAVDRFHWIEDGDLRLYFEPLFAHERWGSEPDGSVAAMRQAGFDPSDADDSAYERCTEAAFALGHHLTGVRLTPELLEDATFLGGTAPVRGDDRPRPDSGGRRRGGLSRCPASR